MASPKLEVFFLFDMHTNNLVAGQGGMSFLIYKDSAGNDLAAPSIVEIGGGAYGFLPTFPADPNLGVVYVIDTGANVVPTRVMRYVRPEDYTTDSIPTVLSYVDLVRKISIGKWSVVTSGPDENRLVLYDLDGTTVIAKFNLTDASGNPTTDQPYTRTPVP